MRTAEEFTNDFMQKLKDGVYEKDNLPNNGPKLSADFVKSQTDDFSELLQSELGQTIIKQF